MNHALACESHPDVLLSPDRKSRVLLDLRNEFHRLNREFFAGRLSEPKIEFSCRKSYGGYYQKHCHRIVLSWQAYEEHGWDETLNTFRHEVAHIVHQNHAAEFWKLAHCIGVTRKYAAMPLKPVLRRTRRYIYRCPKCKREMQRCRRFQANASCARCDTKYNPEYSLELVRQEVG